MHAALNTSRLSVVIGRLAVLASTRRYVAALIVASATANKALCWLCSSCWPLQEWASLQVAVLHLCFKLSNSCRGLTTSCQVPMPRPDDVACRLPTAVHARSHATSMLISGLGASTICPAYNLTHTVWSRALVYLYLAGYGPAWVLADAWTAFQRAQRPSECNRQPKVFTATTATPIKAILCAWYGLHLPLMQPYDSIVGCGAMTFAGLVALHFSNSMSLPIISSCCLVHNRSGSPVARFLLCLPPLYVVSLEVRKCQPYGCDTFRLLLWS